MKFSKKHIIIIVVVLIVIIGGSGSNKDNQDSNNTQETTKQDSKKTETVYGIGDVLTIGSVDYTVTNMTTEQSIGGEYLNTTANDTFVVIDLEITNHKDKALNVSSSNFKLTVNGKEYDPSTEAMIYLSDEALIFENINPEVRKSGKIVFDVTAETASAQGLSLKIQNSAFGSEKGSIILIK